MGGGICIRARTGWCCRQQAGVGSGSARPDVAATARGATATGASTGWQPLEYVGPRPVPQYPGLAYLEGFSGTVIVRATVQPDGRVADTQIDTSSGHLALDEAALRAVRQVRFNAISGASAARNRTARIPFHFSTDRQRDARVVLLGMTDATPPKQHEPAIEWPSGYVHPRYEQAATTMQFKDALDIVRELAHAAPPVSGGPHLYAEFVERAASGDVPNAIWFALDPANHMA